ncbi:MAG TPA: carboxypeptidase regulatory-like domain-containing protein [Candidatus Sulfotelmatobacter sp.]|nr:carboxypeptidase regulatory-like domain-containing protein [Candidatus Sulfotelmatobacter sp.]
MPWKHIIALSVLVLVGSSLLVLSAPPAAPAGGTITGKVTYTGTPPKMKPIDMSKEPVCNQQHNPPEKTQTVVTGANNALEYVVVYISAGEKPSGPPSAGVRYDQKGCMYIPHVLPMLVNQDLKIYTDDPVAHNIHPLPKLNAEWNKSQPPGAPAIDAKWEKAEFIAVKCNIHPWMHGYFAVLETPHYAVTDENGNYTISGVPPGKYTLTAWQESNSPISKEVTVTAGETKADFTFKVLPY